MDLKPYFLLLQFSCLIPISIGLVRYHNLDPAYRPFLLWLILGFINETVNYLLIKFTGTNVISFNVFQIIEALLLIYQLMVWGFLKNKPSLLYWIAVSFILVWSVQNLLFNKIFEFYPVFRIFYAFAIVLIIVNEIIFIPNERPNLLKNSKFILCSGLILLFVYQIIYEGAIIVSHLKINTSNTENISSVFIITMFGFMNVFLHIVYGWGILAAKKKPDFSFQPNNPAYEEQSF